MYRRLAELKPAGFNPGTVIAFGRHFVHCFASARTMQVASALAYTTLLSLVPMVAVTFGFLGAMPGFGEFESAIREFVFNNFVPAFGETVDQYLNQFADKASQLTLTGVFFLLVVALMLMATIENAFNGIWKVGERRRPTTRFLVYWLLLTLGPILVAAGLAATSYFLSLPAVDTVEGWLGLRRRLLPLVPFLISAFGLSLLYILVPNCRVPRRNAIIGAVVAAVLFESAKFGFGLYVKTVPTYEAIYGALAVLPVFLIWIYLSWIVVLLGAQLTYSLSTFRTTDTSAKPARDWDLIDVCLVLCHLWHVQREGQGLSLERLAAEEPELPVEHIITILDLLEAEHWILEEEENGHWILIRDLSEQTLLDLHHLVPRKLPDANTSRIPQSAAERTLQEVFDRYRGAVRETLSLPIKSLFLDADREPLNPADGFKDAGS